MRYSLIIQLLLISSMLCAQVNLVVKDTFSPAYSAIIGGEVGAKFDASYQNRILAQDYQRLIEPFKQHDEHSCWQGEFWGKWFTSAVLAYMYKSTPELKAALSNAVEGLIATQTPEAYTEYGADPVDVKLCDYASAGNMMNTYPFLKCGCRSR